MFLYQVSNKGRMKVQYGIYRRLLEQIEAS